MAHFAKLDENNNVIATVVVDNDKLIKNGVENEEVGINYLRNCFGWENWKQYSYNTGSGKYWVYNRQGFDENGVETMAEKIEGPDQSKAFRKNAAGIGSTYDPVRDAFIPPRPTNEDGSVVFSSWTLNEETCNWDPPIDYPNTTTDGILDSYDWNESTQSWDGPTVHKPE